MVDYIRVQVHFINDSGDEVILPPLFIDFAINFVQDFEYLHGRIAWWKNC